MYMFCLGHLANTLHSPTAVKHTQSKQKHCLLFIVPSFSCVLGLFGVCRLENKNQYQALYVKMKLESVTKAIMNAGFTYIIRTINDGRQGIVQTFSLT